MRPEAIGRIARLHRIRNTQFIMGATPPQPQFIVQDRPLLIGPVLAEFGHELCIAAMARKRGRWYKNVIVSTLPERQALYADFKPTFRPHDIRVECSVVSPVGTPPWDRIRAVGMHEGDSFRICEYTNYMCDRAEWIVYGEPKAEYKGVVVVHARSRNHVLARNWPISAWQKVVTFLHGRGIKRIVSIGTMKDACHVPETEDMRGIDLAELMNVLRSALLAVGPSSGPMHLASLCKCPHVVWCGGARSERMHTALRYRSLWNPYGTPCMAVPFATWRPPAAEVVRWLTEFMEAQAQNE